MPRAKGGSIPPPRVNVHPGQGSPIAHLNANDVLSGRGGRINNHPGNITFRTVVEDYKREYLDPQTRKLEKAHVAARLVAQIRSANPPGRFLKEDPDNPGMYVEIGDQKAWKKAGQALREDAPDVRKEIGKEMVTGPVGGKEAKPRPTLPPPPKQPAYHPHHRLQHPHNRPGVPPGIPPSVSYSPTSAPMPLPPPAAGGARPDPPEAVGVTGYRTAPLRYQGNKGYFESGRGGRIVGGRGYLPGRGRGRGPPPHHRPGPPSQGGYHHQNFYNQPPPSPQALAQSPHPQHYAPPPPGTQQPHPPHSVPHQYQQPYQHHPHQYHPNHPPPPGYNAGPQPQPQFTSQDSKQGKKGKASPAVPPIVGAVAHGVHQTVESRNNKVKNRRAMPRSLKDSKDSAGSEFPPHMSVATDFTMSDISQIGDSKVLDISNISTFDASMKASNQGSIGAFNVSDSAKLYPQQEEAASGDDDNQPNGGTVDPNKQSTGTNSSSSKSKESFTMSDLMGSGFSLGMSGRTRSFPDLMLSTGDLLPPLQMDSDKEEKEDQAGNSSSNSHRDGPLHKPFHRHSSSESSDNMGGFHPVRRRSNTGNSNMPCLNDAMSIMSLDSRKSLKSDNSSWLDNFRSMQSIHSDMNPWEAASGRSSSRRNNDMIVNDGTDGSVRSFLSDVSVELSALDLAEPLLPPIDAETGLNDSNDLMGLARPDP